LRRCPKRSLDKTIKAALGQKICYQLTVADCAAFLESVVESGKARSAQALRTRLIAVCKRGQQLGWMESNPAEITAQPEVTVKRGRLTLDTFNAIYAKAGEVAEWLPLAMRLALVTGADRSTIAGLQRKDIADGFLTFTRGKTGARIAVPLELRLDALGWTLADVVSHRSGVLSKYLVHHVTPYGNAPTGSKVHPDRISHAFTEARKLAKIADEAAPTMHECRSLCSRLYLDQGGVDVKSLLGHATQKMSDMYANPRGVEPIRVRVRM
jgi:integrase